MIQPESIALTVVAADHNHFHGASFSVGERCVPNDSGMALNETSGDPFCIVGA
jgi:hypothetical protein